MPFREPAANLRMTIMIGTLALLATLANAVTTRTLHHFNSQQGKNPLGVVIGPDGNLYGATVLGGSSGAGTVFELTPTADGGWQQSKTYAFTSGATGYYPNGNLIFDSAGNLYGTLEVGLGNTFAGEVFELSPTLTGWEQTTVHNFLAGEAYLPNAGVIADGAGNLYGTGRTAAFELSPVAGGGWVERTLHTFADQLGGEEVLQGVILDGSGNLYGSTLCGGTSRAEGGPCYRARGAGTIWELSPQTDGSWTKTTLYSFKNGSDGGYPVMVPGLVFDSKGNLYGTTQTGGHSNHGTVFELSPIAGGGWIERNLHSFNGSSGNDSLSGLIIDGAGNLYGETSSGGETNNGVVFALTPNGDGTFKYKVLRSFKGSDGSSPRGGLSMDPSGNIYGTTWTGGKYGNGTVFEITP